MMRNFIIYRVKQFENSSNPVRDLAARIGEVAGEGNRFFEVDCSVER